MNYLKRYKPIIAIMLSFMLTGICNNVLADSFKDSGIVNSIDQDHIQFSDQLLRISPTVKVYRNEKEARLNEVQPGDSVTVEAVTINKRNLVTTIYIHSR